MEEAQKEKRKAEEEELKGMKREAEVWKYINKKRGARKWSGNSIDKEEWRRHFMDLLEGEEMNDEPRKTMAAVGRPVVAEELEDKEIRRAINKLKLKKAAGTDGIPMEAWKYAGESLSKELTEMIRAVWQQGTIPKDWKTSIVTPLYKRGDKEAVGNYRGISLLCTAYKVYAEVLRNRLEKEVEEKGMIPDGQAGFRKGRATVDNIFVLNHIMQRDKRKEGEEGKIYMFFVDLRAAFEVR